jgi:hypothetical protein
MELCPSLIYLNNFSRHNADRCTKGYPDETKTVRQYARNVYSLVGTIYGTRMNSVMVADKTRIDSANPDSDADIVRHSDLKDEIYQVVIQIK